MKTVHVMDFVNEVDSFTKCLVPSTRLQLEHLILKIIFFSCVHFDRRQQQEILEAMLLAARIHTGIYREDGVTPYIIHTLQVACLFFDLSLYDHKLIISAIVHDTVEDTEGNKNKKKVKMEILKKFRSTVDRVVWLMTKDHIPEKRTRYWIRFIQEKNFHVKWRAIALKVGDRIMNAETFYLFDEATITRKVDDTLTEFPKLLRELGVSIKKLQDRGTLRNKKLIHLSTRLGNRLQYALERYTSRR